MKHAAVDIEHLELKMAALRRARGHIVKRRTQLLSDNGLGHLVGAEDLYPYCLSTTDIVQDDEGLSGLDGVACSGSGEDASRAASRLHAIASFLRSPFKRPLN